MSRPFTDAAGLGSTLIQFAFISHGRYVPQFMAPTIGTKLFARYHAPRFRCLVVGRQGVLPRNDVILQDPICRRKHGSHIGKQKSPFHIRQFLGSTTTQNLYKSIYHLQVDDLDSLSGSVHWNTDGFHYFHIKLSPKKMNRKHTCLSSICCLWNWGMPLLRIFAQLVLFDSSSGVC